MSVRELATEVCSMIEHELDVAGEDWEPLIQGTLEACRYTRKTVEHFHIISNGQIYKVSFEQVRPATREELVHVGVIQEEDYND